MKVIIVGAGIGGLSAALHLHRQGIPCTIYEKVPELLQLGVGLTLLPHAMTELDALGLVPALDRVAVRTEHLYYRTRHGQGVWDEPRGLPAGYKVPQFSIHRAHLQQVLLDAVRERLPEGALVLDAAFEDVAETAEGVTARFRRADGSAFEAGGDILVGADGIHSAVRRRFHPDEGMPRWSGLMLWRGAVDWPGFMDGRSIIISGGTDCKFILYPIGPGRTPGTQLMNWAVVVRQAGPGGSPPAREDWNREAKHEDLRALLTRFTVPEADIAAMVAATPVFWEFPMCDRDPLARWSFGRVTLLGDAAHPMYPFGANGAAQAILDGRALADVLASGARGAEALRAYEAERLPKANDVVARNRIGGPERVIDEVESRAPDPFADVDAVLPHAEREAIVRGYSRLAGFATDQLARARA
ncbi:flavin-dependent oxidoreductase [Ruixingdingia sedimenti]|uniref:Flavin-dependent oxidoreductase n=1 Tax=Ruixingdingia sedimenti TaxID=3073604 RepID=A0ABU1FCK5_9RHOB|nr:flavin-dependent oxidoreductase [Xinfangfangia sp. LG-4]MDR5654581.1 flavin-dependent oxidoreductase [Xinfangfangia sp. LG-4]